MRTIVPALIVFLCALTFISCKDAMNQTKPSISKETFGNTGDGTKVFLWTLKNKNGITVKITNYGGIVTSILAPDRTGKMGDIVLGYDDVKSYIKNSPYFGSLIGRYGNRIAKGRFKLDGKEYKLATNNNGNHLHGGNVGYDKVVWNAEELRTGDGVGLRLKYLSKDGEEGFPGNLDVTVDYVLTDSDELKIDYAAVTDKATPVNLTHHSYFNLAGAKRDVLDHEVMINADKYMPVDATVIPTGVLAAVEGTPFDFREPRKIGERIGKVEGGYDNNFVLRDGAGLRLAAKVSEPESGRTLEVLTTEPGLQFYSGNFLDGTIKGKGGIVYSRHYGFCMETQHFPDSPNRPAFPSTILRPGEKYQHTCIYKFGVK
ncbi:MAG TPA: aldose epimerase family protein [Elusimicrobiales bacterium]|nr:aldose epimerase family protein [Elusimicrobiales bacterium]